MAFRIRLQYIIILLCFFVSTSAQNIEQIYMKSGSVVEGYIAEQIPGKYIAIQTTKATTPANGDSLQGQKIDRITF